MQTALTLTLGVQAETRIVPAETKPNCPFPAQLDIVPQLEQGRVNLAVPIDVPFTELNRLLEAQLKGKTFPEDKSGAFAVNVRGVSVAASGDRLLISLRVKANETRSWFGLGAEATVHVWGRPVLDSDAADASAHRHRARRRVGGGVRHSGRGGARHRAVSGEGGGRQARSSTSIRWCRTPARASRAAIADLRQAADGVRVDAAVTALRLVGIEFDAKTLRVIAEADGTVRVAVTALPLQ